MKSICRLAFIPIASFYLPHAFAYGSGADRNHFLLRSSANQDSITAPASSSTAGNSLDLAADYYSNTQTFGRFSSFSKMPAVSASVSYTSAIGFYGDLIFNRTQNSDTSYSKPTSDASFSLGYKVDFLEYLSLDLSYMHYLYSKTTASLKSFYSDQFGASLGYDFNWFGGSITAAYLTGKQSTLSFTFSDNFTIEADDVFTKGDMFLVQPGVDLMASSERSYYLYLYKVAADHPKIFKLQLKKKYPSLPLKDIETVYQGMLQKLDALTKNESYSLNSVGLSLPVSYTTGNITISVTLSAYKQLNQKVVLNTQEWQMVFDGGITYSFGW